MQIAPCPSEPIALPAIPPNLTQRGSIATRRPIARAVAVLACGAALLTVPVDGVFAQAQPAAVTQNYGIPAGPLGPALQALADTARTSLTFSAEQTEGRTTKGVSGSLTPQAALEQLLEGTGLQADPQPGGGYVLRTVAATAAADTDPGVAASLPTITATANQLGEITEGTGSYTPGTIATATRLPLTPRETPQSISVTTRQQMDDFGLTAIDQVMAHTPGVSIVTYDSERTEYYARGFAIQNFQYDGIPMTRNSAYSAGNTLSDTSIYDRVEVLKGATGLLTGSGTPGATINLIRKKPTRTLQGQVSLSAGRWDSYRGEVDISGALNESGTVRARAIAAQQDRHSHLDRYERKTSTFYGILEFDLGPRTLLTVGADRQDNKPRGSTWGGIPLLNAFGAFNAMPRSFNNGANWSHWDQYTRTGFATLEHYFDNGWVAKAQFNHQVNGYDANLGAAAAGYPNPLDGSGVSMWAGQYVGRTTSDAVDVYASGPFKLAGREHELVLGGSIAKRRWRNRGYWDAPGYDFDVTGYYGWQGNVPAPVWNPTPDFTDDETTRERGLYTAARWNLRDDLKLITGGRWSSYRNQAQDMRESGVFVPYVGAVYDLNDTYSVYASYTDIFTPQAEQDASGRTLDPRTGKNYETGVKAAFFDGKLNASAAVFQLKQDNFPIETGAFTPSGGIAYRAAQGVKTRGYEFEVSGQVAPDWQMQAGFSRSVSRQDGDRVSTLTPSKQFSLYTTRKLGRLTLGGGARWQDKTWGEITGPLGAQSTHTAPAYWLVDLMARYDFSKQLSASLTVNNALDKRYYTIFSWYSTYTWGTPRSVNVSMTYRF